MTYQKIHALAFVLVVVLSSTLNAKDPAAATQSSTGVRLIPNIEYAAVMGKSLLLDLYLPPASDTPSPLVVYIHGGAWWSGDKRTTRGHDLAPHGFAVASINYRLSQEAVFPAQVEDCKAAIRWLRAHARFYNIDGDHIGVWGESAGGHLAALVGTAGDVKQLEGNEGNLDQSSRVQAVCDFFGPTDFLKFAEQASAAGINPNTNSPSSPLSKLIGGPVQEHKEKATEANPITYITKECPPFLIMHGSKDQLVPVAQSEILRDALQKAGVEVKLKVIDRAGHGLNNSDTMTDVVKFFDKHLKVPTVAPTTQSSNAVK